jgi:hypothetical protein
MRRPIGILALCAALWSSAACADPSLNVVPPEVLARTLPTDAPIEVEVHLKAGDKALTAISISTFSNDGIIGHVAKDTPATLPNLSPNSEYSWRLELTGDGRNILADTIVHIRVAFDVAQADAAAGGTQTPPTHQLLYTLATIKPSVSVTAIELAKAVIKGAPETLAHERPGQAYVVVTNEYAKPLTVKEVRPLGPSYICLVNPGAADVKDKCETAVHPRLPLRILPGQDQYLDYKIEATSQVVPGKYALIAAVDVVTDDNLRATVMTPPQDINVTVLGESDVLKFLGIPSLLFLPGVLMLIWWQFLWSFDKADEAAAKYKLKWNTSDFWIIAVALSLATALIYPWLTGLFPFGSRNFIAAYGLLDFGLIFGVSLIGTGLVFGGWRGVTSTLAEQRAREARESMPSEEDGPREILEKLVRLKKDQDYVIDQYTTAGNPNERLMLLGPWSRPSDGDLWLVPPAELTGINADDPAAAYQADLLWTTPPLECAAALAKLREGIAKHWWTGARWRLGGEVRKPIKVPHQGWNKVQPPAPLIQRP